jgi:predicted Zn-dependent protease
MGMLVMTLSLVAPVTSQAPPRDAKSPAALDQALSKLSPPRPHPLPATLAQQPSNTSGDYLDQIQTPIVGALVWSSFPVRVYIEPETLADRANPFLQRRSQQWISAVQQAVQEWNAFLPMKRVEQAAEADITIWRRTPPLQLKSSRSAGDRGFPLPRARSAETRYELYAKPATLREDPPILAHRMTIYIRPDQAVTYLQAAARHELGHAIGIWGHSPNPADALYFSQVRNPASISQRDINTLKRIYQQPTRLGWAMQRE